MDKLNRRIELKVTEKTFLVLQQIENHHGLSPQVVSRLLLDLAAKYYETNGHFTFPIILSKELPKINLPVRTETIPQLNHATRSVIETGGLREDSALALVPALVTPKRTHKKKPNSDKRPV